ncbi:6670_t:CDS:1 [Scutellospora calospora]|uniref:6670_t:CDS:1 n=1 Tax=Scutellospora calospora TaxID=85575 RepID=A0ACA9KB32_9GLOM|nr:6670_t:CDS:1 [Scutellospora calospora]
MAREGKNPEKTITRNGVLNFIAYIKNSYNESAFPIKVNRLREYLIYKVEVDRVKAKTLKFYLTNIKAHHKALGHKLNYRIYGAVKKEALNKYCNVDYHSNNHRSSFLDAYPNIHGLSSLDDHSNIHGLSSLDDHSNIHGLSSLDDHSSIRPPDNSLNTHTILSPNINNINVSDNDPFIQPMDPQSSNKDHFDSSSVGAHFSLPTSASVNASVTDPFIQPTHFQTSNTALCNLSSLDVRSFPPLNINVQDSDSSIQMTHFQYSPSPNIDTPSADPFTQQYNQFDARYYIPSSINIPDTSVPVPLPTRINSVIQRMHDNEQNFLSNNNSYSTDSLNLFPPPLIDVRLLISYAQELEKQSKQIDLILKSYLNYLVQSQYSFDQESEKQILNYLAQYNN